MSADCFPEVRSPCSTGFWFPKSLESWLRLFLVYCNTKDNPLQTSGFPINLIYSPATIAAAAPIRPADKKENFCLWYTSLWTLVLENEFRGPRRFSINLQSTRTKRLYWYRLLVDRLTEKRQVKGHIQYVKRSAAHDETRRRHLCYFGNE